MNYILMLVIIGISICAVSVLGQEYKMFKQAPGQLVNTDFRADFDALKLTEAWMDLQETTAKKYTATANQEGGIKLTAPAYANCGAVLGKALCARIPATGYESIMKFRFTIRGDDAFEIGVLSGIDVAGSVGTRVVTACVKISFDVGLNATPYMYINTAKVAGGHNDVITAYADGTNVDNWFKSIAIGNVEKTWWTTYELALVMSRGLYTGVRYILSINGKFAVASGLYFDNTYSDLFACLSTYGAQPFIQLKTSKSVWLRLFSMARV